MFAPIVNDSASDAVIKSRQQTCTKLNWNTDIKMTNINMKLLTIMTATIMALSIITIPKQANSKNNEQRQVTSIKYQYYKVVAVKENDTLSMRVTPSPKSRLVLRIPYDATGLLKLKNSNKWAKISYSGKTGWVHRHYLQKTNTPSIKKVFTKNLDCFGGEPH